MRGGTKRRLCALLLALICLAARFQGIVCPGGGRGGGEGAEGGGAGGGEAGGGAGEGEAGGGGSGGRNAGGWWWAVNNASDSLVTRALDACVVLTIGVYDLLWI